MPTKAKFSAGFTKAAQKQKFVRNRDILLKEKEVKKEQHIQRTMCEGVCPRCREKVQWRFRYNKYKPLKVPANCQQCKRKSVNKAYRTLCDSCASAKKVCSSCCRLMEEAINESNLILQNNIIDNQSALKRSRSNSDASEDSNHDINNNENDDNSEMSASECADTTVTDLQLIPSVDAAVNWDERKFQHIAFSKYSKDRVVGSKMDSLATLGNNFDDNT